MIKKVNGKDLHLTTFEVETSSRNVRRALVNQKNLAKFNASLAKSDEDDPETQVSAMEDEVKMMDSQVDFLKTVLKLSEKQVDKLWDAPFEKLFLFAGEVTNAILGVDAEKSEESEE